MRSDLSFRGFSLIEMLVVVSIVCILASVTLPSYSRHIDKSRRTDGIIALLRIQLAQEQQRTLRGVYSADWKDLGFERPFSPDAYYALAVDVSDDNWTAVATPRGAQRRDACGKFAIGAKGPIHAPPYANRRCWSR